MIRYSLQQQRTQADTKLYVCERAGLNFFINKVNNNNIHEIQEKKEKPAILCVLSHFSNQKQKKVIQKRLVGDNAFYCIRGHFHRNTDSVSSGMTLTNKERVVNQKTCRSSLEFQGNEQTTSV